MGLRSDGALFPPNGRETMLEELRIVPFCGRETMLEELRIVPSLWSGDNA